MSPLEKAKAMYFFLLMLVLLSLYVTNMMNVANNPAYLTSPSAIDGGVPKAFFGLLVTTAVLMSLYGVFFIFMLIKNFWYLFRLTPRGRSLFLFNLCMLLIVVATVCFGVYSPLYSNGHIFVFF